MNICCLIDSLNSGGAQRQMTWLIRALTGNGHSVRLLTYYQYDHYLPLVRACDVEPQNIKSSTKVGRFWSFRKAIRQTAPDDIISFLDTPNLLGLFASMPPSRIHLIVSERSHNICGKIQATSIRFNAFRLASKVVTNRYAQNEFVSVNYPFLKNKLATILNCVDLEKFHPSTSGPLPVKILVGASVHEGKNPHGLLEASIQLAREGIEHQIDWYGNDFFEHGKPTAQSDWYLKCQSALEKTEHDRFQFHPSIQNIEDIFGDYHACCLPSFREGCPNIICEAMASGLPVLGSKHGDMKKMLEESNGGFLFDPYDSNDIANSIKSLAELDVEQMNQLGVWNREFAENRLSPNRFAAEYEALIQEVSGN